MNSTFLSLAAIWLSNFFPFTLIFISSNIQKRSSSFVVQDFIFIQTNISRCRQDQAIVSDNFKRNLHHFNMKKVKHVQFFHVKMKEG